MADMESAAETAESAGGAEQLAITDQAYWERDLNELVERWLPFQDIGMIGRTPEQLAQWDNFMWQNYLHLREHVQRLALQRPVEAPKPPKRTRMPKAALPALNGDGPDAA